MNATPFSLSFWSTSKSTLEAKQTRVPVQKAFGSYKIQQRSYEDPHRIKTTHVWSMQCDSCKKKKTVYGAHEEGFHKKKRTSWDVKIHTGEKLHMCDQCGKRFAHARSLKAHLSTHPGERLLNNVVRSLTGCQSWGTTRDFTLMRIFTCVLCVLLY